MWPLKPVAPPYQVGDRLVDAFRKEATVIELDPQIQSRTGKSEDTLRRWPESVIHAGCFRSQARSAYGEANLTSVELQQVQARVIELARKRAEELNVPWGDEIVARPLIPFRPSGPTWRIFSIRLSERLVVTLWVNQRTGRACTRNATCYASAEKFERRLKSLKCALQNGRAPS